MVFHCGDCEQDREDSLKYIVRFKDEHDIGAAGRTRRSETHTEGDRIRCIPCHSTLGRIFRSVSGNDWSEDFASVGADARAKLVRESHDKMGKDLEMNIRLVIEETKVTSQLTTLQSGGGFMDEEDLDEKYKSKPKQLENIKKYGKKMMCPVRKIELFQDPEYVLTNTQSEKNERHEKRKVEAEIVEKAPKPKKAPKVKAEATEASPVLLSAAQLTKLKQVSEKVSQKAAAFRVLMGRLTPPIKEHVPKFQVMKAEVQNANFDTCRAAVELATEQHVGDFKHIMKDVGDNLKNAKVITDVLTTLIDEAQDHISSSATTA